MWFLSGGGNFFYKHKLENKMKEKEAKQIIESEFGDLQKEDRSQYDTLVSLLVKYGADDSRPLEKLVSQKTADEFTDKQLEIIGKAIENFLVKDTMIIDENNKELPNATIHLRNDAQGIRYWLGLEKE